jgi:hypothetical protein
MCRESFESVGNVKKVSGIHNICRECHCLFIIVFKQCNYFLEKCNFYFGFLKKILEKIHACSPHIYGRGVGGLCYRGIRRGGFGGRVSDISKSFFNFFLHESYIRTFPICTRTNPVLYFGQAT